MTISDLDKTLSHIVLGTIAPVALLLTGWWGSYLLLGNSPAIGPCAITGLAAGIVLDVTLLRRKLGSLFILGTPALAAVALFYSIMIYGFFMGFPVFNLAVGIVWGYVVGRRAAIENRSAQGLRRESCTVAAMATGILFAFCVSTALLALNDPTIGLELQGMLSLDFEVTQGMVYALIFVGGGALLAFEYGATVFVARRSGTARDTAAPSPL